MGDGSLKILVLLTETLNAQSHYFGSLVIIGADRFRRRGPPASVVRTALNVVTQTERTA